MPFKIPEAIKKFDFKLSGDGLPLANVILLGGIRYVEVCPCCSCIHQLPVRHEGDTYAPNCILKVSHPKVYAGWLAAHPDAAQHTHVELVYKPVEIASYSEAEMLRKAKVPSRARARVGGSENPEKGPGVVESAPVVARIQALPAPKPVKSVLPAEAKNLRKLKVSARVEKRKGGRRAEPSKVTQPAGKAAPIATP